jgi:hypothetical protein
LIPGGLRLHGRLAGRRSRKSDYCLDAHIESVFGSKPMDAHARKSTTQQVRRYFLASKVFMCLEEVSNLSEVGLKPSRNILTQSHNSPAGEMQTYFKR